MAIARIPQEESGRLEGNRYWEESCYRIGCARARQEAAERLAANATVAATQNTPAGPLITTPKRG